MIRERVFLPALAVVLLILVLVSCDSTLRDQIELYVSIKNGGVIYVDGQNGSDANPGTPDQPKRTIQNAIDLAAALMDEGQVWVAEGTYVLHETLVVREGISIFGAYQVPDWTRNLDLQSEPTTIIQGSGIDTVIKPEQGVTTATVIEGFTIIAASEDAVTCIWCDHCSPTIRYNFIDASEGVLFSFGIYNKYASPVVDANTINAGRGSTSAFGIWNFHASPKIWNNVIFDEGESSSYRGIYNDEDSDAFIQNNTIRVGTSSGGGTGIRSDDSVCVIENNIFFSANTGCAIYEYDTAPLVTQLNNNDFYNCGTYYENQEPVTHDFSGMETYLNSVGISIDANVDVDPKLFDPSGTPWEWYLSGTDFGNAVSKGGKPLANSFNHDREGVLRTVDWSIGAYEKE